MAGRRLRHSTRVCAEAEARIGAGPNATPPAAADRLDRGEPPDEETEGGTQPADKSLINRRLKLRPSAGQQLGVPAAASLPRASPANCCPTLDRGHKRLAENKGGARCYLLLPELGGAHRRMERIFWFHAMDPGSCTPPGPSRHKPDFLRFGLSWQQVQAKGAAGSRTPDLGWLGRTLSCLNPFGFGGDF